MTSRALPRLVLAALAAAGLAATPALARAQAPSLTVPAVVHDPTAESPPARQTPTEVAPVPADAPSEVETPEDSYAGLLSFRIIAGTSRAYPDNTWVFGFGAQAEADLDGVLELVFGAAVLMGEASEVFPIELLVKKTLHLAPEVALYGGIGPIGAVVTEPDHDPHLLFGGTANVGLLLWHTPRFGMFIEAAYQLLFEDGPVHDIEGAVGVGWRF